MSRASLVATLLLATAPISVFAQGDSSILMQRISEPGHAGELFVFVGEQVSYESSDFGCEGCWVFDSWHKARYSVAEWIHGNPPSGELEFDVAEHAERFPFGHSRYALVFVERMDGRLALVKYEQKPVYPTADFSFASCGPLDGGPEVPNGPLDPASPELRDIVFAPRLVVDDARRMSGLGRKRAHDPRWHGVDGDEVLCNRGIPLAELVPALVRRNDMLKVALPGLAEAPR